MIKLVNISKSFKIGRNNKRILNKISLEANPGDILSITGQSGCGKTTILNIIAGLVKPDRGQFYLNGKTVCYFGDFLTAKIRRKNVGLIYQTFNLVENQTVYENLLLPIRISGSLGFGYNKKIENILKSLNILEFKNSNVNILSGGQKQRVAIGRALINNPEIILADEPTANLDKKNSNEIFKILKDLSIKEKKIIIIVTHKDYMLRRSSCVYELKDGLLI